MSPFLSDEDACIHFNWDAVLKDMKTYTTFNSLKQYISRTWLPEVSPDIKYILHDNDIIDTIAQHFYPRKDGPKDYMPVETCGDGNCGYRALAHVLLSDESWHHEVHVRITFVAVLKAESFLIHQVITRGVTGGSANRPASYALYLGLITPEITRLSEDSIRTDTKCDNDNDTKETGETSDVTNEKEGENDKESDVKEDTMRDTKCDVTESDDPEKNRDVTEDNQVKEKVNEGTEEQKDKENAKEENDTSESDIVVLAQYKEKKKNIEVIDLMTSSSDENKCDVIDEDAKEEQKRDIIDEDAKEEQKRDIIDEGVKCALKWQKVPRKIAVKRFYKGGKAYSSEGDVCEKEIEKQDGS